MNVRKNIRIYTSVTDYYNGKLIISDDDFIITCDGCDYSSHEVFASKIPYIKVVTKDIAIMQYLLGKGFSVSTKVPGIKVERIHITLSPIIAQKLKEEAAAHNCSKSAIIEGLLKKYYE